MVIGLQIRKLHRGAESAPPPAVLDFKTPGLARVNDMCAVHWGMSLLLWNTPNALMILPNALKYPHNALYSSPQMYSRYTLNTRIFLKMYWAPPPPPPPPSPYTAHMLSKVIFTALSEIILSMRNQLLLSHTSSKWFSSDSFFNNEFGSRLKLNILV